MINTIKNLIWKFIREPQDVYLQEDIQSDQNSDYIAMISQDLEKKYEDKVFEVPIQLINFEALLEYLAETEHPAIQTSVEKPYSKEDFPDLQDDIAEVISDYLNTHLKALVNSTIQEYLSTEKIKMSVEEGEIKYYTEEEDEDIDGLIRLERSFRTI